MASLPLLLLWAVKVLAKEVLISFAFSSSSCAHPCFCRGPVKKFLVKNFLQIGKSANTQPLLAPFFCPLLLLLGGVCGTTKNGFGNGMGSRVRTLLCIMS